MPLFALAFTGNPFGHVRPLPATGAAPRAAGRGGAAIGVLVATGARVLVGSAVGGMAIGGMAAAGRGVGGCVGDCVAGAAVGSSLRTEAGAEGSGVPVGAMTEPPQATSTPSKPSGLGRMSGPVSLR